MEDTWYQNNKNYTGTFFKNKLHHRCQNMKLKWIFFFADFEVVGITKNVMVIHITNKRWKSCDLDSMEIYFYEMSVDSYASNSNQNLDDQRIYSSLQRYFEHSLPQEIYLLYGWKILPFLIQSRIFLTS